MVACLSKLTCGSASTHPISFSFISKKQIKEEEINWITRNTSSDNKNIYTGKGVFSEYIFIKSKMYILTLLIYSLI